MEAQAPVESAPPGMPAVVAEHDGPTHDTQSHEAAGLGETSPADFRLQSSGTIRNPSDQFSSGVFRLSDHSLASLLTPAPVSSSWRELVRLVVRQWRNAAPLMLGDLLAGAVCLLTANIAAQWAASGGFFPPARLVYLLPALVASLGVLGLYPGIGISPVVELRKLSLASASLVVAMLTVSLSSGQAVLPTLVFTFVLGVTLFLMLPTVRSLIRTWLTHQSWWGEPVLIFGGGALGSRIHGVLTRDASRGMRSLGFVDELHTQWGVDHTEQTVEETGYLGPPEIAEEIVQQHGVQWVVLACGDDGSSSHPGSDVLANERTLECLRSIPNRLVIGGTGLPSLWTESRECAGAAALHVGERLMMPWPQFTKRTVDILASLAIGVLASPLYLLLAALVKLTSKGEIFYGHDRIGRDGQRFRVWKFRTMVKDADAWLQECLDSDEKLREEWQRDQKLKRDPRITSIGRFLRKSSLDELPQLWNVLRGDMSLVGPRPIVDEEVSKYKHVYPMYTRVRPGITGLWQISGRNQTTYEERITLDNYYVRNWSPWLDIYILARTVRTVLLREGAY